MNVNGQQFWMMSERDHFTPASAPMHRVSFDPVRRCLHLSRQRDETRPIATTTRGEAEESLDGVPHTLDGLGNRAFWQTETNTVAATGAMHGTVSIATLEPAPLDLVMGHDGILYLIGATSILMHDRGERWRNTSVTLEGFRPWRAAPKPDGGLWVLDRINRQVASLDGEPLPELHALTARERAACEPNPTPPSLTPLDDVEFDGDPIAIAASPEGRVAILCWNNDPLVSVATVCFLRPAGRLTSVQLNEAVLPFSIGWISEDEIALLTPGRPDQAFVYHTSDMARALEGENNNAEVTPVGDLYPLAGDYDRGPFAHTLELPCRYVTTRVATETDLDAGLHTRPFAGTKALRRLGVPSYATEGEALNDPLLAPFDSGDTATRWHRLFVEAVIPSGCSIDLSLATTNQQTDAANISADRWYLHCFHPNSNVASANDRLASAIPQGVWESMPSEIPHHEGFIDCPREPGTAGLFSVLIQRNDRRLRSLSGRFLHIRLSLHGTGRTTPQIFAVRAYANRFSYVEQYLPQLYKETLTDSEDTVGAATRADFLDRFVANFEGTFTAIEDRIANAHLLTDPLTTPDESLEWLGSWIGFSCDEAVADDDRRKLLANASTLHRWRGTLRGLKVALDLATADDSGRGAISGGEIVVIEDFRLRRTFTTIVGSDLAQDRDPLTTGEIVSGNSYIGDTLFLGDGSLGESNRAEFLALFAADLDILSGESDAIAEFFDRLAHRVTVLVHDEIGSLNLGLIKRVAMREIPAHVELKVLRASSSLLVGMASLVGIDTYLGPTPEPRWSRIGEARIGLRDYVAGPASLDPRYEGIGSGLPIPRVRAPVAIVQPTSVAHGTDVLLDARRSRAFSGNRLARFNWSLTDEDTDD